MSQDHVVLKPCALCGKRITLDEYVADTYVADAYGVYHRKCKDATNEQDPKINSAIVNVDDIDESIIDGLIDEMGKMPTDYMDVQVIVTVIVTPLPDATSARLRRQ